MSQLSWFQCLLLSPSHNAHNFPLHFLKQSSTVCLLIKGSHSSPVLQKFTSPWGTEVTLPYFNHFDSFPFLNVIIIFLIFWNSKDVNPLDQSIILNVEYILFILKLIFCRKSAVSPVSSSNMVKHLQLLDMWATFITITNTHLVYVSTHFHWSSVIGFLLLLLCLSIIH